MTRLISAARSYLRSHLQVVLDVTIVVSCWLGVLVASNITEQVRRSDFRSLVMAAFVSAVTLMVMRRRGLYAGQPALPRTEEISRVFFSVAAGASALAVFAALTDWPIGATEILVGAVLVFGGRVVARGFDRALRVELSSGVAERVVIVGTGDEAKELAELITDHPESQFLLAGVVGNLAVAEQSDLVDRWIGPTGRLIELMRSHAVTGAIVTANGFRGEQFREITRELFRSGYDVHLTTGVSRMGEGRFSVRSLSHEPLIVMERNGIRRSHRLVKRAIDLAGATVVLLLAAPLMLLAAALIWIEDRGPVTYSSPRAGRRGQFFRMHKFRSMVVDADAQKEELAEDNERTGPIFKLSNDPRVTRIGRFIRETSIDELPQLFNVLKGDMSLVGPRPALPEEEAAFDEELRDRFGVRPGITGLWQVEARSNASFAAYRRLDLHYVENWTISLDLRILLATAEQVLVTLLLLPLRRIRPVAATDGVAPSPEAEQPRSPSGIAATEDVVIDIRDRVSSAADGADDQLTTSSRVPLRQPTSR